MTRIGFVGLGSMGAPLAGRLLPGNEVQGTNRTRAKAGALIEQGMIWRDTPREAATGAQVVFSMVTDDAAVAAITSGPDGILAGLGPGSSLMHKDIRLALETARESKIPLPAAAAADRALSEAERLGFGHRDIAGLFRVLSAAAPALATGAGEPAGSTASPGPKAA